MVEWLAVLLAVRMVDCWDNQKEDSKVLLLDSLMAGLMEHYKVG